NLLELVLRVVVVTDRAHHEIGAARVDESLELLGALGGGADDAILPRERSEVLRVALAQEPDPRLPRLFVVGADGDEGQVRVDEAVERAARGRRRFADARHALP